jgi:cell division septation protein DedD
VSDSHDQSYYEIALTNRQVMSIFVVLLICILVSFLGGVWLGRDADASVEMASTQSIVATEAGAEPLEELDFFTRRSQAAKAETAESRGDKVQELVEASAGQSGPAPVAAETMGPTESAATPGAPVQPAEKRTASAPVTIQELTEGLSGQAGSASSLPASQSGAGTGIEISPAGASEPVSEAVIIQVFSSIDESQARRVVDQLRTGGYPAILSPVEVDGRILHRVRLGPYTDPDEARVVADSVERTFKLETWITH